MIYVVTDKAAGAEIYRYEAEAPIEWGGMEFAAHDHTPLPEQSAPAEVQPTLGQLSKLAYMSRFTDAEIEGIYGAAKVSLAVEVWLEKFKLAEFIDLADPRTLSGLQDLEAAGLIGAGRALEVLHGN